MVNEHMQVLENSRILVAWLPVGVLMGAYDLTLRYLKARRQFGSPLAAFALSQEKLVRIAGTVGAMWQLVERLSRAYAAANTQCDTARPDQSGQIAGTVAVGMPQVTMAKAWNTRAARECITLARELLGGNGVLLDFGVAKAFCDMEALYTYEGTYDINSLVSGRFITGISAFKIASGHGRNAKSKL